MSKPPIPPMPDLGPEDLPDIRTLSHKQLEAVPYDSGLWICCVQGCTHQTAVRDYGLFPPVIRWRREWVNVLRGSRYGYTGFQTVFFCSSHWPGFRRAQLAGEPSPWRFKPPCQIILEAIHIFPTPEPWPIMHENPPENPQSDQ